MLNKEKIKIMTRLASFEKQEERRALRTAQYYRVDFIRYELFKMVFKVTLGYCCIILLLIAYYLNDFLEGNFQINYEQDMKKMIGCYVILLVSYLVLGLIGYNLKYNKERKKLKKYNRQLKKLRRYQ